MLTYTHANKKDKKCFTKKILYKNANYNNQAFGTKFSKRIFK